MAKRKVTRKKKIRRKSRKSKLFHSSPVKIFAGLAILVSLMAIAGLLTHFLAPPEKLSKPADLYKSVPAAKQPIAKSPTFEIYPAEEIPPLKKPIKSPIPEKQLPRVAIIIDDLGYDKSKCGADLFYFAPQPFSAEHCSPVPG